MEIINAHLQNFVEFLVCYNEELYTDVIVGHTRYQSYKRYFEI